MVVLIPLGSQCVHNLATVAALRMMVTAYCSVASYAYREKPMVQLLPLKIDTRIFLARLDRPLINESTLAP